MCPLEISSVLSKNFLTAVQSFSPKGFGSCSWQRPGKFLEYKLHAGHAMLTDTEEDFCCPLLNSCIVIAESVFDFFDWSKHVEGLKLSSAFLADFQRCFTKLHASELHL